jgi:hypothetical protein
MSGLSGMQSMVGRMYQGATPQQQGVLNMTGVLPFFRGTLAGGTGTAPGSAQPQRPSFVQNASSPAMLDALRAARAGRSASMASQAGNRGTLAAGGVGGTYGGMTLGGGR